MNYGKDGHTPDHASSQGETGRSEERETAPPAGNADPAGSGDFSGTGAATEGAIRTPAAMPRHPPPAPTRAEVEDYRGDLELRLLERYNNLPEHAGNVGKVTVVLSKPPQWSLDGEMIRAEFDQLVFDPWGGRIPELEKEYYVVTFGSGGVRQVRADPSIRVGLDLENAYSERTPLNADPFRRTPEDKAFGKAPAPDSAPKVRMPEWWRPDFPELR